MKNKGLSLVGAILFSLGVVFLLAGEQAPSVSFLFSNSVMILLFGIVVSLYGPISIPSFVFAAAYFPSFAFLWVWLRGASYINYHNFWLQDDPFLVNQSVYFPMVSIIFALSILLILRQKTSRNISIFSYKVRTSKYTYLFSIASSVFFTWLTEPTFKTILTSSYSTILESRISGTQFAGGLLLIFWLISFVHFSINTSMQKNLKWKYLSFLDRLFLLVTALMIIWLIIHARRSELIGIGVVWLLSIVERKGAIRAVVIASGLVGTMIFIEIVRGLSLSLFLSEGVEVGRQDIARLPGGMSNVFMTLINALDYFENYSYFGGETFFNYLLQILPKFVYGLFNIEQPEFFTAIVFKDYSYNGGTYLLSVFYGNFGVYGAAASGVFVAFYIVIASRLLASKEIIVRVIGLYMIAIVFRAFWYGLLTLLKPIIVVLIPIYLVLRMGKRVKKKRHKIKPSMSRLQPHNVYPSK